VAFVVGAALCTRAIIVTGAILATAHVGARAVVPAYAAGAVSVNNALLAAPTALAQTTTIDVGLNVVELAVAAVW
jgi:hypothetical protein